MSPMQRRTKYIGMVEVGPGARIAFPSNRDTLSFTLTAVCESAEPERWHGEVIFAGTTLITTPTVDDYEVAGRAAEQALTAKVIDLFST